MDAVVIDGSKGEGGGQMLRTALAFSSITGKPLKMENIRANRQKPGLKPQHMTVVNAFQEITDGKVDGAKIGGKSLEFTPGDLMPGAYTFDIGTAGSITLLLQALMPAMVAGGGRWAITAKGGTDTAWSPSWDYFKYIFMEHMGNMGMDARASLGQRGFYPKGGGEVSLVLRSSKLTPFERMGLGELSMVAGRGFISNLELEVWERMKAAMLEKMISFGSITKEEIVVEHVMGSKDKAIGATLWSEFEHTRLGYCGIGAKGVKAEDVGENIVKPLIADIASGATMDAHAADQVLPYGVIAGGTSSFLVRELSQHALTNIDVIKSFVDVKTTVEDVHGLKKVTVEGGI